MSVADRVAAFDLRNGGNPIPDGFRVLFPSGAYRDSSPLGVLADADRLPPFERARNALKYQELKLAAQTRQFENLKECLLQHNGFNASEKQIEELSQLQRNVRKQQRRVREAKKALDDATPDQHKPHRPDPAAEEIASATLTKIQGIKI